MKTDEILRSIGNKEMEIIQRRVRVNYNNRLDPSEFLLSEQGAQGDRAFR